MAEKIFKDLEKEEQLFYLKAISAAREGYQFGEAGAREAVYRFSGINQEYWLNEGVQMAIRDANPKRAVDGLVKLLEELFKK